MTTTFFFPSSYTLIGKYIQELNGNQNKFIANKVGLKTICKHKEDPKGKVNPFQSYYSGIILLDSQNRGSQVWWYML
jgi:hypothetical protein